MKLTRHDKCELTIKVVNCLITAFWFSFLLKSGESRELVGWTIEQTVKTERERERKRGGLQGKGLINRLPVTSLFSSVSGSMAKLQVYSYLWGLPCLTWQGKAGAVNSSGCYEPLISLANEACNLAKPRALWTADTIQTTSRKNANALMNLEGKGKKENAEKKCEFVSSHETNLELFSFTWQLLLVSWSLFREREVKWQP